MDMINDVKDLITAMKSDAQHDNITQKTDTDCNLLFLEWNVS